MQRFFLCILGLALAPVIFGQEEPVPVQAAASFRFGLKVGPNIGSIRAESDELQATDMGSSLSFGLLGDISLSDRGNWWVGTGLVVTNIQSSFKMDATVDHGTGPTDVNGHMELRTRYLEVPATLKWRTTTPGPFDFYALLGGSGAFHLQSRVNGTRTLTIQGSMGTTTNYDDQSANDDMAFFKVAVMGGAGIEYTLASGPTFFVGVTYSKATTNAMDNSAGTFVLDGTTTKLYADYAEVAVGVFL